MENINPLRGLITRTKRGEWVKIDAFASLAAEEFVKVGYVLDSPKNISIAFSILKLADFIEHDVDNFMMMRIMEHWYDAV